jgi:hypothetical protein
MEYISALWSVAIGQPRMVELTFNRLLPYYVGLDYMLEYPNKYKFIPI